MRTEFDYNIGMQNCVYVYTNTNWKHFMCLWIRENVIVSLYILAFVCFHCLLVCVCLSVYDWSVTAQLSSSQMVQIWMPGWWFFQPQWGPEWLSEILEELEDRMRHKLDLLTKDNESDMQLSNLISLKHAENIQRRAASHTEAKNMFRLFSKSHSLSHVLSEDLAQIVGYYTMGKSSLFSHSFLHVVNINQPLCYCLWSQSCHLFDCCRNLRKSEMIHWICHHNYSCYQAREKVLNQNMQWF